MRSLGFAKLVLGRAVFKLSLLLLALLAAPEVLTVQSIEMSSPSRLQSLDQKRRDVVQAESLVIIACLDRVARKMATVLENVTHRGLPSVKPSSPVVSQATSYIVRVTIFQRSNYSSQDQ